MEKDFGKNKGEIQRQRQTETDQRTATKERQTEIETETERFQLTSWNSAAERAGWQKSDRLYLPLATNKTDKGEMYLRIKPNRV